MGRTTKLSIVLATAVTVAQLSACSTAPKAEDRAAFIKNARSARNSFETSVSGLREQIQGSAGYVVFPDVMQWGFLISGGAYGRGAVYDPEGRQIGWAAINTGALGLQTGIRGFRMLVVLENEQVLADFKANKWTGSVSGVVVVGES